MASRLQELATQKEQELCMLREKQQKVIEASLKSCQEELEEEKRKRKVLENDFKYNLSLIEQRDHDLLRYETLFEELKKLINTRMGEMSDLRVQIDDLSGKLRNSEKDKADLKKYYVQRLEQQQSHMDRYCKSKDADVAKQSAEYDRLQKQLQQKLLQVEEELAMEKQKMLVEKEDSLRTQAQEHRVKLDELTAQVLSKDAHLRQLQRELSLVQNGAEQKHKDATNMEDRVKELEKKLRETEWYHTDEINALQAKITELEGQLSHAETTTKALRTDSDNKRVELERMIKEKEATLQAAKKAHIANQTDLERELGEVRAILEQSEVEGRRKEWNHTDTIKEKDIQIEKLQEDMMRLREEGERRIAQHSQDVVQGDLQLQSLQSTCDKLKDELTTRIQDIQRYKHELHLSSERERSIERSKAQMELDWQTRIEDMERSQYGRQEELLRTLASARDQSLLQCKLLEDKLIDRVRVCESVRQERDIALDALQRKGLTSDAKQILEGRGSTEAIETLHRQNRELREVINHMRKEMETIATPDTTTGAVSTLTTTTDPRYKMNKGYVLYLESENKRLTEENTATKGTIASKKPPSHPPVDNKPGHKKKKRENANVIPKALKTVLDKLQEEKSTHEFDLAEMRSHIRQLEATIKSQEHQSYIQKALQIPKDKVHQKLLQATRVIISLAEERDVLTRRETELKAKIQLLEDCLKKLKEEKVDECSSESEVECNKDCPPTPPAPVSNPVYQYTDQQNIYHHPFGPIPVHASQAPVPVYTSQSPVPVYTSQGPVPVYTSQGPVPVHTSQGPVPMYTSQGPVPVYTSQGPVPVYTSQSPVPVHISNGGSKAPSSGGKLSLSPLRFSDSSASSDLHALTNAMKLVNGEDTSLCLNKPTPVEQFERHFPKARGKENRPFLVEGNQIVCQATRHKTKASFRAPSVNNKQQRSSKIRNYNIKD